MYSIASLEEDKTIFSDIKEWNTPLGDTQKLFFDAIKLFFAYILSKTV